MKKSCFFNKIYKAAQRKKNLCYLVGYYSWAGHAKICLILKYKKACVQSAQRQKTNKLTIREAQML